MIQADVCNSAVLAVLSGKSFEQSGLPQTDEGRDFWETLSQEIDAIKRSGGTVGLADELTHDPSSRPVSLSSDVESRIDLPDISDVSFPTMVGTRKPRRKRVQYKGVSLSRKPTKFEASVLSLESIPKYLDLAVEMWLTSDDETRARILTDVAQTGSHQVLLELTRQGAPDALLSMHIPIDASDVATRFLREREEELQVIRHGVVVQLSSRHLPDETKEQWTEELVDRRRPALDRRYANYAVNEAFAYGRKATINLFQRTDTRLDLAERDERGKFISLPDAIAGGSVLVDAVIQTAVMDLSTCEECEDVDGEVMDFGSSRQRSLRPPYVKCLGGLRCRCVQIALLSNGKEIDVDEIDEDTLD